ncbi:hypothetical protein QBC36DRAFT_190046 [Triangularia setosa]|uniref:Uncharacterized protein n=1 Tax=Triangularia setosa TaxID=2587417 RepID=A0AAN6W573_9PEZI|nr:hypothetical protein QBC36DRAFT_190046 [Podospora setosa]
MQRQPSDFLRGLALHIFRKAETSPYLQTQLVACLQWLCEFQVLACIPLDDAVPFKDVADICGVPEGQLCRVSRLMITSGFLQEPQQGHVGHSSLSAQFVTEPALLDAVMFLSGTAAPASLKMPTATKQYGASDRTDQSAYTVAFDTGIPLASVFELQPRLQRQFGTYLEFVTNGDQAGIRDVLMRVDWGSLGNATVVDVKYDNADHQSQVGAHSPATAVGLVALFPTLQFIVQMYETASSTTPSSSDLASGGYLPHSPAALPSVPGMGFADHNAKVTLQKRFPGTSQLVRNAAIYILHLPSPSPSLKWSTIATHAVAELTAHVDVLRANPGSRLILTALVLPPPGTVDVEIEAAARLRDISLLQLSNGRHAEKVEVVDLLNGIRDSSGGFVVTDEIRCPSSPFVALEIRYQSYDDLRR